MTEKELIRLSKKGNKQAFAELYGLYKNRLYRYACYRLGNTYDAQDAVCDTVVCAYEQIGSLKKASAFNAWIFKIHHATCSKYITRQIETRENAHLDDFKNSAKLSQELSTLSIELNEGLNILNDQERAIVLLSVIAGFKSKEISAVTGLTDGAVRSKLSRSLAKLREFLE